MKLFVRNKRGSLSLSMEAIVILILAVVMLGLGLTFVRTMFGNITDKATTSLGIADLEKKPSVGDPVTFTPSKIDIKEGDTEEVIVGFYNSHTTYTNWIMEVHDGVDKCGGLNEDFGGTGGNQCHTTQLHALYNDQSFLVEKDQAIAWNVIMQPQSGATGSSATKPFLLTVRFCGADAGDTPDCTATDAAIFQKEIFINVRR